ncbi:hypothetical protein Bpfe_006638 [Biomphalaria pfeifferi]|uniref:Uncharacterized protein n=1 Tax=Biomphalaria pfeifferi TaxID=112525 RepID=A0AAD8C1G5_BIOPF|nr:hypothetical protein Bpfe_006638 [Biomphalaria pfeifferi]
MKGENSSLVSQDQLNRLGPSMQLKRRSTRSNLTKSLQGHLGAEHIWSTLRSDSLKKLHLLDEKFPPELKATVSAHVREGLTKHKKPVSRNFVVTDDVPDLKQLMDQSFIKHIRNQKHKAHLMYHSSQKNHDRSKILLFNNPLPNLAEDGISKFLPVEKNESSEWMEKGLEDKNSIDINRETENLKPLKRKTRQAVTVQSPLGSDVSETLQDIWSTILSYRQPRKETRYHFLTEKEAAVHGQFRQRYENYDTLSTQPKPLPLCFNKNKVTLSAPVQQQPKQIESPWQPLSLQALVEYKEQKKTEGQGNFHLGRPKMWKTSVKNTVEV